MDRLPDSTLRRIVVTCLQISAILLLFALPAGAQRQTTVRLWGTGGFGIPKKDATDPFNRANRAVVEAFEKRHPEINLEIINGLEIDGPANDSQMLLAMAGGTAPDVLYVNFRQLVTYVDQDFLYPLDEFIKLDPNVLTRIHKPIRDVITVGGHIYSYPYQQAVQALYYRKDLYRLAGLNPDKPPATWDEFYQYCQALTKPEIGQFGFGFVSDPQSTAYWWINFLWQAGGEPVTQLPNGQWKSTINSPAGVTALEFYRKLVADEWKMPNGNIQRGVTVRTTTLMKDYVEKGRLGMWFQYQTDTIANRATANISPALIGIARMPKGPTGIRANEINAYMYGISALQQDPAVRRAAWEFIKYMGSEEADKVRTEAFVEQGIGSMISPDLLIKYGYEDLVTPQNKQWAESLKALVLTGKPEPHGKNSQMIYTELDDPLVEIGLFPDRDPQAILDKCAARIDAKLLGYVPEATMSGRRTWAYIILTSIIGVIAFFFVRSVRAITKQRVAANLRTTKPTTSFNKHKWTPWAYMAPALLTVFFWAYFPLVRGLVMAFQDYRILKGSRFVGLDNFIEAATQRTFWLGIAHSVEYVVLTIGIGFCLPIVLALFLSEIPRGKVLFRTAYYLPAVTSGIVILFLWKEFYDPTQAGLINQLLGFASSGINTITGWIGMSPHLSTTYKLDWLGNPTTAMLAVVIPGIWAGAGPGSIIYLAALTTVPEDVYEAADLDGASIWTKIRMITIPTLRPLIIINLVGAFIGSFKAMENIFVMTGGGPLYRTHVIGLEVWYNAFMYLKFGYATAAAWIMGSMLIGFTLYQLRLLKNMRFSASGG